jgi:hypothetical protein
MVKYCRDLHEAGDGEPPVVRERWAGGGEPPVVHVDSETAGRVCGYRFRARSEHLQPTMDITESGWAAVRPVTDAECGLPATSTQPTGPEWVSIHRPSCSLSPTHHTSYSPNLATSPWP